MSYSREGMRFFFLFFGVFFSIPFANYVCLLLSLGFRFFELFTGRYAFLFSVFRLFFFISFANSVYLLLSLGLRSFANCGEAIRDKEREKEFAL